MITVLAEVLATELRTELDRLAALDEAPPLEGPVVLALVDGDPVAALSLDDRRVVADPFVATNETVALLRLRATQLAGGTPGSRIRYISGHRTSQPRQPQRRRQRLWQSVRARGRDARGQ